MLMCCLRIARLGSQAHLGVRLKKDGYKVIGADWKKQEYFEEVEPLSPPTPHTPPLNPSQRGIAPGVRDSRAW